jgi:hypothetical protein
MKKASAVKNSFESVRTKFISKLVIFRCKLIVIPIIVIICSKDQYFKDIQSPVGQFCSKSSFG